MAVTHKKDPVVTPVGEPMAAEVAAPPPNVVLELCAHKRYVIHGVLYVADTVYTFSAVDAAKMLRLAADNGVPVFRRWVKKPNVRIVEVSDNPPEVNMVDMTNTPARRATTKARRVDIGDDDEIADILSAVPIFEEDDPNKPTDRGDLTRDDLGDGVRVG